MDEPIMLPAEAKRSYHRALIRKKLEEKGVEQVQAELGDNAGFIPFQLEVMHEWLLEKRQKAAADEHAKVAEREQREIDRAIAREANDIARAANTRADRANVIAIAALVVSLLTAGVAALFI